MFLNDTMNGIASYLGTTQETASAAVALITLIVVIMIVAWCFYKADLESTEVPLVITAIIGLSLFTIFGWIPVWVPIFIIFLAIVYLVLSRSLSKE